MLPFPAIDFHLDVLEHRSRLGRGAETMVVDEQQWFTFRWPYLRDSIRAIMMRHCDEVVYCVVSSGEIPQESWDNFLHAVLRDLDPGRFSRVELGSVALDLMAEPAPLRESLCGGRKMLMADDTAKARIYLIKHGLTRMRNIRLGGTEHRGKTWGALDRISRALVLTQPEELRYGVDRCSMEHFIALLEHLRTHHRADHNLPRTLKGIEEYFHEFCEECGAQALDDGVEGGGGGVPPTALPDFAMQGGNLEACLLGLGEEERAFVAVKFDLDPTSQPVSVLAYCTRLGIDRTRFGRVVQNALRKLHTCLNDKIERSYAEPLGYRTAWQEI